MPGEGPCGTLIISSIGKNPGDIFAVIQIHRHKEFDEPQMTGKVDIVCRLYQKDKAPGTVMISPS